MTVRDVIREMFRLRNLPGWAHPHNLAHIQQLREQVQATEKPPQWFLEVGAGRLDFPA